MNAYKLPDAVRRLRMERTRAAKANERERREAAAAKDEQAALLRATAWHETEEPAIITRNADPEPGMAGCNTGGDER